MFLILIVKTVKSADNRVLRKPVEVRERWEEYFKELLNEEFPRREAEEEQPTEGSIPPWTQEEVRKAIGKMKLGKAAGPDGVPVEAWKVLGDLGINWLTQFLNRITKEGKMPDDWINSTIVPIFKQKGDASECSNYRGIKLISHTMKIYERLVDSRLREMVPISQVVSQTYRQFCAPVFRRYFAYAWVAAGYVDTHPGHFSTPADYALDEVPEHERVTDVGGKILKDLYVHVITPLLSASDIPRRAADRGAVADVEAAWKDYQYVYSRNQFYPVDRDGNVVGLPGDVQTVVVAEQLRYFHAAELVEAVSRIMTLLAPCAKDGDLVLVPTRESRNKMIDDVAALGPTDVHVRTYGGALVHLEQLQQASVQRRFADEAWMVFTGLTLYLASVLNVRDVFMFMFIYPKQIPYTSFLGDAAPIMPLPTDDLFDATVQMSDTISGKARCGSVQREL
ncbi:unnamed protein product [Heligmosomoides polygyrus]|uniref:RdRp catalytic domain-containing protein n=1 Tax=Heligmosomoides polygyrus TaxID=6339 RepID=A0A183FJN1_HELPZ|nr:unnamed protein product [Heligmosomoides polygyrus]